jgi:hypothetical protein
MSTNTLPGPDFAEGVSLSPMAENDMLPCFCDMRTANR